MNLWIVSQNGDEFALVNRIYIQGNFIYGVSYGGKPILLGTYCSHERCIEIRRNIVKGIAISEQITDDYETADIQIKATMLGYMIRILEMPKE